MIYNTCSFRIKGDEGYFTEDKTLHAHEWLDNHEKNMDWRLNRFASLESAIKHGKKAALYIARRFDADAVCFSISGEEDTPSLDFKKSGFFKEYEIRINMIER